MKCPICGGNTRVAESFKEKYQIVRRRKCQKCEQSIYTREIEQETAKEDVIRLAHETNKRNRIKRGLK